MYFITGFQRYEWGSNGVPELGAVRTFGYYARKEWAVDDLHNNALDIRECLYNYAVIEYIPEGLYQAASERIFFKWDDERKGFFEIDETAMQDNFGNYAIG